MLDTQPQHSQCQPGPLAPTRFAQPPGLTDCHFHIFGTGNPYPFTPERRFTPNEAPPSQYAAVCEALGIQRGVLVQPSVYGVDNRRLIAARSELGIPTRLVVMVPADVKHAELERLSRDGAVGVRLIGTVPGGAPLSSFDALSDKLHEHGWHIQVLLNPQLTLDYEDRLAKSRCRLVIDHMAQVPAHQGVDQEAFQALLRLVDTGRVWVKCSAPFHLSTQPAPYADLAPLVRELARTRPDRLLWGSDWPCVNFHGDCHEPANFLDAVHHWLPNEEDRLRMFVDNPAELYGFGKTP